MQSRVSTRPRVADPETLVSEARFWEENNHLQVFPSFCQDLTEETSSIFYPREVEPRVALDVWIQIVEMYEREWSRRHFLPALIFFVPERDLIVGANQKLATDC